MVAPTFPIKGGIAAFATSLFQHMKKTNVHVDFFSWKKQIPSFIVKNPYDFTLKKNEEAQFSLTWYNPLSWVHTARMIASKQPDILLHQWVSPFFAIHFSTINRLVKKWSKNTKVIYSVHNVSPHEASRWTKLFRKFGFSSADGFIVHAQSELEKIKSLGITNAQFVTPPTTAHDANSNARSEMRKQLGLSESENVVLFFGYVREYKGLDILIRALKNVKNATLVSVGQFNQSEEEYQKLIDNIGVRNKIKIVSGYVPEDDVTKYFQMSDLVAFPYRDATFSGPIMIAIDHLKPVVCTSVGCFTDIITNGKTGYMVPPENPEALAQAINRYFDEKPNWSKDIAALKSKYSWDSYIEALQKFA